MYDTSTVDVLAAVVAVSTALYTIASYLVIHKMEASNRLLAESQHARARPYVWFDIVIENKSVHAALFNAGKSPAYEIRVEISPEIIRADNSRISFVERQYSFLACEREIRDALGGSPQFLGKYRDVSFSVKITYLDSDQQSYTSDYVLDTAPFLNRQTMSISPDPLHENMHSLQCIAQSLDAISGKLNDVSWQLDSLQSQNTTSLSCTASSIPVSENTICDEDRETLKHMMDNDGRIHRTLLHSQSDLGCEKRRDSLKRLAVLGLVRMEQGYWTLTSAGHRVSNCQDPESRP